MIGNLLQPELVELIEKRDFAALREILCNFPAPELAEIFTDLKAGDEAVLLRILPRQLAADVFEYLSLQDQEQLSRLLATSKSLKLLTTFRPTTAPLCSKNCRPPLLRSCSTCLRQKSARSPPICSAIPRTQSDGE